MNNEENNLPENDPVKDPLNYRFGIFYHNRSDRRLMPRKRFAGAGWEINFGHRNASLLIAGIFIGAMLLAFGLLYIAGLITGESFFNGRTR